MLNLLNLLNLLNFCIFVFLVLCIFYISVFLVLCISVFMFLYLFSVPVASAAACCSLAETEDNPITSLHVSSPLLAPSCSHQTNGVNQIVHFCISAFLYLSLYLSLHLSLYFVVPCPLSPTSQLLPPDI